VYFSGSIYTAFIETLTKMDLTEEQIEAIKASLCEITKLNPNRVETQPRSPYTKYNCDDPIERHRLAVKKNKDNNPEVVRERSRIYMRNKREAARLAQDSKIVDVNFNGVVMV
jgi:hypothetical protein